MHETPMEVPAGASNVHVVAQRPDGAWVPVTGVALDVPIDEAVNGINK